MTEYKRVSDVVPAGGDLDGTVGIEEVKDRDLLFEKVERISGKYGELAILTAIDPKTDEVFRIRTGAEVVLRKLQKCVDVGAIPVYGKVVKVKRYYDIS